MEKARFTAKVDSMMPDLIEGIRKECSRLYDSGGVDTTSYGDDYKLPKTILTVAIENQIRQYSPPWDKEKKLVKNLGHF